MSLPGQPDRGHQTELTHLASGTTGMAFPPEALLFPHLGLATCRMGEGPVYWLVPGEGWKGLLASSCRG